MTIEKNELNIVSSPCKKCMGSGSYAVVIETAFGKELEEMQCECVFYHIHGIEDTTGEEE